MSKLSIYGKAKEVVDSFIAKMDAGELPEMIATQALKTKVAGDPTWERSFMNQLLVSDAGFISGLTYNQWQELGRTVKPRSERGTSHVLILAPITKSFWYKKKGEDGEDEVVKGSALSGYRSMAVFDYNQTTGEPLPEYEEIIETAQKVFGVHNLDTLLDRWELDCGVYDSSNSGALGYITHSPEDKKVHKIRIGASDRLVLYHEIAHIADIRSGQFEYKGKNAKTNNEIVAQLTAEVLARILGDEKINSGLTVKYIEFQSGNTCAISRMRNLANRVCQNVEIIVETMNDQQGLQASNRVNDCS